MTALAADKLGSTKVTLPHVEPVPVAASTTIYKNAMVAADSNGRAVPAADTAGLQVLGIAVDQRNNSAGAAGAIDVPVQWGVIVKMAASGLTQAMLGDELYVVDDQTVAPAGTPTNDIPAGKMVGFISSTECWLFVPGPQGYPTSGVTASPAELNLLDASASSGVTMGIATGTLAAAEINDLKDTQITAVAAPGAGRAIVPTLLTLFHDHGGTDFVQAAGTDHLALRYEGGVEIDEIGTEAQFTAFIEASADANFAWPIPVGWVPTINEAVEFDNNGATDYTTGDGTIDWVLVYFVVPMA